MKQIKLRAWDRVEEKMYYAKQEQQDDALLFRFKHFVDDEPRYMSFTGITDEAEVDIYEGDLCGCWEAVGQKGDKRREYYKPLPVVYSEVWASFVLLDEENKVMFPMTHFWAYRVIANICQNPKLTQKEE